MPQINNLSKRVRTHIIIHLIDKLICNCGMVIRGTQKRYPKEIEFNKVYSNGLFEDYISTIKTLCSLDPDQTIDLSQAIKMFEKIAKENYKSFTIIFDEDNMTLSYRHTGKRKDSFLGDKINSLEGAFIIDNILSKGEPVSNKYIYSELKNIILNINAYVGKDINADEGIIRNVLAKYANQRLKKIIFNILSDSEFIKCTKKSKSENIYQYKEEYSIIPQLLGTNDQLIKPRAFVKWFLETSSSVEIKSPNDIDLIFSNISNNYAKKLTHNAKFAELRSRFNDLRENRNGKNWAGECLEVLREIEKYLETNALSKDIYSDFLIEYAEFISLVYIETDETPFDKARSRYHKAIEIAKNELKDNSKYCLYLIKYAIFLHENNQYNLVKNYIDNLDAIFRENKELYDGEIYAEYEYLIAKYNYSKANYSESKAHYKKSYKKLLTLFKSKPKNFSFKLIKIRTEYVNICNEVKADIKDVITYYIKSLEIKYRYICNLPCNSLKINKAKGIDSYVEFLLEEMSLKTFEKAEIYHNLGIIYMNEGNYSKAKANFEKAIICEEELIKEDVYIYDYKHLFALTNSLLAKLEGSLGHYTTAYKLSKKAIEVIKSLRKKDNIKYEFDYAQLLYLCGGCRYGIIGKLDKTIERSITKCKEILTKLNESNPGHYDKNIIWVDNFVAKIYFYSGEYQKAKENITRALELSLAMYEKNNSLWQVYSEQSLASLLIMIKKDGLTDTSEIEKNEQFVLSQCKNETDTLYYKNKFLSLYYELKLYDYVLSKSLKLLEQCKKLIEDNETDNLPKLIYFNILENIANCYKAIDNTEEYHKCLEDLIYHYDNCSNSIKEYMKYSVASHLLFLGMDYSIDNEKQSLALYERSITLYGDICKESPIHYEFYDLAFKLYISKVLLSEDKNKAIEDCSKAINHFLLRDITYAEMSNEIIEIINNIKSEIPSLDKVEKKNIEDLKEACNSFIKYRGVMDNEVAELYKNYNWE